MKTLIFSLTLGLFLMLSSVYAQKVNGYDANAHAKYSIQKGKDVVPTGNPQLGLVKGNASLPLNAAWCACDIPEPWFAKYISPLGFYLKPIGSQTGSAVINNTQVQKKK